MISLLRGVKMEMNHDLGGWKRYSLLLQFLLTGVSNCSGSNMTKDTLGTR